MKHVLNAIREKQDFFSNPLKKQENLRIVDIALSVSAVIAGTVFFIAVNHGFSGGSIMPAIIVGMVWPSLLFVFALTTFKKRYVFWATMLSFVSSVVFMPHIIHAVIVFIFSYIGARSILSMRHILLNQRKIRPGEALHAGSTGFVIVIAIVVSSQYYWAMAAMTPSAVVSKLLQGRGVSTTVDYLIDIGIEETTGASQDLTVDEFVHNTFKKDVVKEEGGSVMSGLVSNFLKEVGSEVDSVKTMTTQVAGAAEANVMTIVRQNMSDAAGMSLQGNEKASVVFKELIYKRAETVISANNFFVNSIAEILAVALFLTLVSLGGIIKIVWLVLSRSTFWLLRHYHVVRIGTEVRETDALLY